MIKKASRFVKRTVKDLKKRAKKRYMTKTGKGLRVSNIAKDVMLLKKIVNAEKKTFINKTAAGSPITVGQVVGNASGHQILDITPIPAQGVTASTRNGNSIKLCSGYYEFYMVKQGGNQALKLVIDFFTVPGEPYSGTEVGNDTAINDLYTPNDYLSNNIFDLVASRKQDTYANFRKVYSKTVYFPANNIDSVKQVKLVKIPLKWKHHVKFAGDASTTPVKGQMLCVIRADNGNKSTVTANTMTGVAVQGTNTGISFHYSHTTYFYDN